MFSGHQREQTVRYWRENSEFDIQIILIKIIGSEFCSMYYVLCSVEALYIQIHIN